MGFHRMVCITRELLDASTFRFTKLPMALHPENAMPAIVSDFHHIAVGIFDLNQFLHFLQ